MFEINDNYIQQEHSLKSINCCKNSSLDTSYTVDDCQYTLKFGIDRLLGQKMSDQARIVEHKICSTGLKYDGHQYAPDRTDRLHSENNRWNNLETISDVSKNNIPTRNNLVKPFPRRVESALYGRCLSTFFLLLVQQ